MNQYYRGEATDLAQKRFNRQVAEVNARSATREASLKAPGESAEQAVAAAKELSARIAAYDSKLAVKPSPRDRQAVARYNALVLERNAVVEQFTAANAKAGAEVEAYERLRKQVADEFNRSKASLEAGQQKLAARAHAYEAFEKREADVVFWDEVNRLLADLRPSVQAGQAPTSLLNQVRAIRRELARWAIARAESVDDGHLIVEARLGDEPLWLIVDTGAQRTTVAPELAEAVGLRVAQGEETTLRLAGGEKVRGRNIVLPVLAVGTVEERTVNAVAVKAAQVGVDGLLGQSFLKRFTYTIDETKPQKLWLFRRATRP
jgi:clan AA aspartic protease (TIGR02281 family)